jgi:hypothetical protein
MKRYLFALAVILCIAGCDKLPVSDLIIDWYPVNFYIQVVDADGKDMLEPSNGNTWLLGTTFEFMGKKDTVDQACLDNICHTRAYLPHFYGVSLMYRDPIYSSHYSGLLLKFGEFDGADKYDDEKLTINWPDGTSNTITYSRKFNLTHTDVSKEEFRLDGKKCSNPIVIER